MDGDQFTLHSKKPLPGDPTRLYTIEKVENVNQTTGAIPAVRSIVLLAKHVNLAPLDLAIKLVNIDGRLVTDEGILREQQIHYTLTQWDARVTRETVPVATSKPGDGYFSTTTKADTRGQQKTVRVSIMNTEERNIVPLYDFATLENYNHLTIPQVPGHEKLPQFGPRQWRAGFLVLGRFPRTLAQWAEEARLPDVIWGLHDTLVQMCALIHLLMAAGFTHGDLHAKNIAAYPNARQTRVIRLASNAVFVLQQRDSVPHFALLDFGFSRLDFTDAVDKKWLLEPTSAEQRERLTPKYRVPWSSFVPGADVFRIVVSLLLELAKKMHTASADKRNSAMTESAFAQFGKACQSVLARVQSTFGNDPDFGRLASMATAVAEARWNDALAKDVDYNKSSALFWPVYTAGIEPQNGPLPWDALKHLGHVRDAPPKADTYRDITIAVPYARGSAFDPRRVTFTDDDAMRVSSLKIYRNPTK